MKRLALVLAFLPATAFAIDGEVRDDYEIALTISPLPVLSSPIIPGAELTMEWKAGQKFGLGFVVGATSNAGLVWDVGLQTNGYFVGDFSSGVLVGAELMGNTFNGSGAIDSSLGLYLGGKYAFSFGLTGMLHVGGAWGFPETDIGNGEVGPLVNVGIGWSF